MPLKTWTRAGGPTAISEGIAPEPSKACPRASYHTASAESRPELLLSQTLTSLPKNCIVGIPIFIAQHFAHQSEVKQLINGYALAIWGKKAIAAHYETLPRISEHFFLSIDAE